MLHNSIREKINMALYDHKKQIFAVMDFLTPLILFSGIAALVFSFGYSPEIRTLLLLYKIHFYIVNLLIIRYFLRIVLSLHPRKFIKDNPLESLIYAVLSINTLINIFLGQTLFQILFSEPFTYDHYTVLRFFFFIILLFELGRATYIFKVVKLNPAALLAFSFILLIAVGTLLLRMPEMTGPMPISWVDALFTSTSACCVTGLTVVDTGTYFTFKGQLVIMFLFLFGGLNILTIATFIAGFYHRADSLHAAGLIKGFLDTEQVSNLKEIIRNVVIYAFVIQICGTALLFFTWDNQLVFKDLPDRLFYSAFHAISAFNNAGFSLFTDGLFNQAVKFQYMVQIEIALLIILGGLGFLVLQDIFGSQNRLDRKLHPWRKFQVNTRLVLLITTILVLSGTGLFLIFEYNNSLSGHSFLGKIVVSFFQSVTSRTAGFNTVDISHLQGPSILLIIVLMFIGASPGSTGGGIKTTTLAVAFKAAWANIRGLEHVEFYKRNISWKYVNKTYAVLFSAVAFIVVFSFLIIIAEPTFSLKQLVFEIVSAFGTVGLSLGITSDLSTWGKIIIIISMFVGRIGFLTLGLALTRKIMYTKYRFPNVKLMIG